MTNLDGFPDNPDDLRITEWERFPLEQRVIFRRAIAELRHNDIAMWVATLSLAAIGLSSVGVLVVAFVCDRGAPEWAVTAIAAIIAAAIALVFNNRGAR
jgi:hypothetical protein